MKHFTWFGAIAVGAVAAAIYWTNRQPDVAVAPAFEAQVATAAPIFDRPPPLRTAATIEFMEPILVLPEWEVAPAPEPASEVDLSGEIPRRSTTAVSPRPEAGRDSRPWMPYAPEDRDLSADRRLAWAKLSIQDPVVASLEYAFEETAEPPLLEIPKR